MPKITVCIPAYNSGNVIGETLDSVLAQTFRDREIIVSDNHSTDDTAAVVGRYAERGVRLVTCPYSPVKTGSPLDNSLSAVQNWNSLLPLGTGEYISLCHADDVYLPDLFSRQVDLLDRHRDAVAVFPSVRRLQGAQAPVQTHSEGTEVWYDQRGLLRAMLRVGQNVSTSGPLIRRSAWRATGAVDAERWEQAADTDFWIRVAGEGRVAVISPPLVLHRNHEGQDSKFGLELYRHRPLPIFDVLRWWIEAANPPLTAEDNLHLRASEAEEVLRVSLNLFEDGFSERARDQLKELRSWGAGPMLKLLRSGRKKAAARLIAASLLTIPLPPRLAQMVSEQISRSRVGFGGR